MANSIYHFFCHLCLIKGDFVPDRPLHELPFCEDFFSFKGKALFPDFAIKLNKCNKSFTGGELVELKESKSYSIASFNSTIPTGEKRIEELIKTDQSIIRDQMQEVGDDIFSLPVRQVFYLIRGRKKQHVKACLVHGSFFETVSSKELIAESFTQLMKERLKELGRSPSPSLKRELLDLFTEKHTFSRTRSVKNASVSLRFRIMTEVRANGNILNPNQYPQIGHDTLNLVVPCHSSKDKRDHIRKMKIAFKEMSCLQVFSQLKIFIVRHHLNGNFLVFQTSIID